MEGTSVHMSTICIYGYLWPFLSQMCHQTCVCFFAKLGGRGSESKITKILFIDLPAAASPPLCCSCPQPTQSLLPSPMLPPSLPRSLERCHCCCRHSPLISNDVITVTTVAIVGPPRCCPPLSSTPPLSTSRLAEHCHCRKSDISCYYEPTQF